MEGPLHFHDPPIWKEWLNSKSPIIIKYIPRDLIIIVPVWFLIAFLFLQVVEKPLSLCDLSIRWEQLNSMNILIVIITVRVRLWIYLVPQLGATLLMLRNGRIRKM